MDVAKAKKKYKILVRERDRLAEKGQQDAEVTSEISKLLADFPELEEVNTKLSAATSAMLSYAEAMQDPLVEPSPPPVEEKQASAATGSMQSNSNQPAADHSKAIRVLLGLAFVVRVFQDIRSRPTFPLQQQCICMMFALFCSVVHRCSDVTPCSQYGFLFDPLAFTALVHIGHGLASVSADRISPMALERILVYVARDGVPSIITVFVTYSVAMILLTVCGWPSVQLFC